MPDKAEKKHVLIVASPRARTGKTLLARLLADHLELAGEPRIVFDTDATERRLAAYFPGIATVVDLERVPDQMKLFDALAAQPAMSQVIDLTHRSFAKFFGLMHEIGYVAEAKVAGVEPAIFYIPDGTPDSYEQGLLLRERFRGAGFVLVRNEAVGEPSRAAQESRGMFGLAGHKPELRLPLLSPFLVSAIEDTRLSLSEFVRRTAPREAAAPLPPGELPLAYLSLEARHGIGAWLRPVLADIAKALRYTDLQAEILAYDRFGA